MNTPDPKVIGRTLIREWERSLLVLIVLASAFLGFRGFAQVQQLLNRQPTPTPPAPKFQAYFNSQQAFRFVSGRPPVEVGSDHAFLLKQDPDPQNFPIAPVGPVAVDPGEDDPPVAGPNTRENDARPTLVTKWMSDFRKMNPRANRPTTPKDPKPKEPKPEPTRRPTTPTEPAAPPPPQAYLLYMGFMTGPSGQTQALVVHRLESSRSNHFVRVGARIADYVVAQADENEIVLRGPGGRKYVLERGERLPLSPGASEKIPDGI